MKMFVLFYFGLTCISVTFQLWSLSKKEIEPPKPSTRGGQVIGLMISTCVGLWAAYLLWIHPGDIT